MNISAAGHGRRRRQAPGRRRPRCLPVFERDARQHRRHAQRRLTLRLRQTPIKSRLRQTASVDCSSRSISSMRACTGVSIARAGVAWRPVRRTADHPAVGAARAAKHAAHRSPAASCSGRLESRGARCRCRCTADHDALRAGGAARRARCLRQRRRGSSRSRPAGQSAAAAGSRASPMAVAARPVANAVSRLPRCAPCTPASPDPNASSR